MTKKPNIHVQYSEEKDKWEVKKDGAGKSSGDRDTQREANELAKRIAEREKTEVLIHRKDNNQIREKNSYGNDPEKSKG